jgi:hypothetical protein
MRKARSLLPTLALLFPLLAGCGDEPNAPAFVGQVASSDAVVAAVHADGQLSFYVCGGAQTYAHLTRWFSGAETADGSFHIENAGWTLTGNLTAGSGTLDGPGGETHAWTIAPAPTDVAGLYSAENDGCRTGAVVGDLDGTGATSLQGTWCNGEGELAQVTPIIPMVDVDVSVAYDGIPVLVEQPSLSLQLTVERVRAPF